MSLRGPSKTIIVEPLKVPAKTPQKAPAKVPPEPRQPAGA
jgi:hypothetical protein